MADEVRTSSEAPSGGGDRPSRGPRPGGPGGQREGGRKFFRRKKVCKFCVEKIDFIDYKDVRLLAGFVAESGKIVPRRLTGVCTPHQRRLSTAIKQARNIALLPFAGSAAGTQAPRQVVPQAAHGAPAAHPAPAAAAPVVPPAAAEAPKA